MCERIKLRGASGGESNGKVKLEAPVGQNGSSIVSAPGVPLLLSPRNIWQPGATRGNTYL